MLTINKVNTQPQVISNSKANKSDLRAKISLQNSGNDVVSFGMSANKSGKVSSFFKKAFKAFCDVITGRAYRARKLKKHFDKNYIIVSRPGDEGNLTATLLGVRTTGKTPEQVDIEVREARGVLQGRKATRDALEASRNK